MIPYRQASRVKGQPAWTQHGGHGIVTALIPGRVQSPFAAARGHCALTGTVCTCCCNDDSNLCLLQPGKKQTGKGKAKGRGMAEDEVVMVGGGERKENKRVCSFILMSVHSRFHSPTGPSSTSASLQVYYCAPTQEKVYITTIYLSMCAREPS